MVYFKKGVAAWDIIIWMGDCMTFLPMEFT